MYKTTVDKVAALVNDKRAFLGNLIAAVAGIGVIIITIVVVMFLGQSFANALPINNSSAFYYTSTFSTYIPTMLTLTFACVLVFLGVLALYVLRSLMFSGHKPE